MHQSKRGNEWYFGMKARIGPAVGSSLVQSVLGTGGNVNDVIEANSLLRDQVDGVPLVTRAIKLLDKRHDANMNVRWHVAMRPGLPCALVKDKPVDARIDQLEHAKVSIRAKVERTFRVLKQQFGGGVKVRYREAQEEHGADRHAVCAVSICGWQGTSCWPTWGWCACRGSRASEVGASSPRQVNCCWRWYAHLIKATASIVRASL